MSIKRRKKDTATWTTRTAAAISGIFFFHSASSTGLRDWFDINTTENLWGLIETIQYSHDDDVGGAGGRDEKSAPRVMGLL